MDRAYWQDRLDRFRADGSCEGEILAALVGGAPDDCLRAPPAGAQPRDVIALEITHIQQKPDPRMAYRAADRIVMQLSALEARGR